MRSSACCPRDAQFLKLGVAIAMVALLLVLNLRGMRESIKVLLPIFLGFFFSHVVLIVLGIGLHADRIAGACTRIRSARPAL